MTKISVVVITYNEEYNIARCLDSVKQVADEIIVLDSFSADRTIDIAREKGATVFQQAFAGYIEQKNKALTYAAFPYVLCLDADEAIDKKLETAILQLKQQDLSATAFEMNRCTQYCGRFIRHGSWYPDRKIRLFNRASGRWAGINPHDKVELDPAEKIVRLPGDILHYSYNTLEEHIEQNNKFSTISAKAYYEKGKRSGWVKMLLNPCWAFIKSYFIKGGLRDGFYGYVIAKNIAHLVFMKYYKLYALQKGLQK